MVASFIDVCRFIPTAGGTTDWTYSSAVTGYQSPTAASAVNAATYRYRAESADLTQWEVGYGVYTSATGIFARTTVLFNNLGSTAKINFSSAPQVAIVLLAEDLGALAVGQIPGSTTNDNANSGNVGEISSLTSGTITLVSNTSATITSLSLTAGDWDVWGNVLFSGTGTTTATQMTVGISTTAATLPATPAGGYFRITKAFGAGECDNTFPAGMIRASLSGTTTYYLVANAIFAASTLVGIGVLNARRVR